MNGKKTVVVMAVLLVVALVSVSSIIAVSKEADDTGTSNNSSALTGNETTQNETEEAQAVNKSSFMFVQTAHSGSLVPVEGEDNLYILTLEDVSPQTICFSDRPERVVVQAPMQKFLDSLCFSPENPPNAAIEILEGDEEMDVAVMKLLNPVYDVANKTLQYTVSILEEANHSYAIFNERHDESLPEKFGPASLFIDDCPATLIYCQNQNEDVCGSISVRYCWTESCMGCAPCRDNYTDICERRFGHNCSQWTWDWLSAP